MVAAPPQGIPFLLGLGTAGGIDGALVVSGPHSASGWDSARLGGDSLGAGAGRAEATSVEDRFGDYIQVTCRCIRDMGYQNVMAVEAMNLPLGQTWKVPP